MADDARRALAEPSVRDHLANERTLLAWIRTSLTVVGLGFLVDRLAVETTGDALASVAGIGLVLLGGVIAAAGGYSYLNARRELASGTYRPQVGLHIALVVLLVVGSVAVATYLVVSG